MWCIDLLLKLRPKRPKGKKYINNFIAAYIKWVEAVLLGLLVNKTAATVTHYGFINQLPIGLVCCILYVVIEGQNSKEYFSNIF